MSLPVVLFWDRTQVALEANTRVSVRAGHNGYFPRAITFGMARTACDGCDRPVSIAGGIANLWTFGDRDGSDGSAMTLEFDDGSSHLLCYPCIAALPDEPAAGDVAALSTSAHADSEGGGDGDDPDG